MARPDESLTALSNEAAELLKLAGQYREKISALRPEDPTRKELEGVIFDLLDRADAINRTVRERAAKP
ncbi:MAG TPA: hypothetical protein VEC60_18590 [Reyranella sp.]|nr:hypothetical protein [Reyranella sp.]